MDGFDGYIGCFGVGGCVVFFVVGELVELYEVCFEEDWDDGEIDDGNFLLDDVWEDDGDEEVDDDGKDGVDGVIWEIIDGGVVFGDDVK